MAQLIKIKSGSSGAAPGSLLTGEPAYSINDNKSYIGNGSSVVRTDAGSYTAECSTAKGIAAKTVNCTGFILFKGVEITVKFTVTNTAAVSGLTLNVGGTGAKPIRYRGTYLLSPSTLSKDRVYKFYYGGDYWELIGDLDIDTTVATELALHTGDTDNPHAVTKSQVGLGSVENTALSSWAGSANITTLGTISSGVWSGTVISVAKGGTGKTSIAANSMLYASAANTYAEVTTSSFGRGLLNAASWTMITGLNAQLISGRTTSELALVNPLSVATSPVTYNFNSFEGNAITYLNHDAAQDGSYVTYENAPWTSSVPGGGWSSIFFKHSAYGTQLAFLYNTSDIKYRYKMYSGGVVWTDWLTLYSSGNINKTTVDWSAKNLTLAGTITGATTITASSTIQATTAKLTNLTDGYLPYHVSDAAGLANSPIYTNGTKIGIGTTNPDYLVHISGNASGATVSALKLENRNSTGTVGTEILFKDYYNSARIVSSHTPASYVAGSIQIQTWKSNGTWNTGMLMDRFGNVAIGTTDPLGYKLYVSGTGHYTSNLSVGGTMGVTGNTTLSGTLGVTGATTLTTANITNQLNFGSSENDKWINFHGSASLYDITAFNLSIKHPTPFIDFYFNKVGVFDGENWVGTSRIIESDAGVLDIQASVKIPSSEYWQLGDARLVYVEASGGTPGYLKLQHSNGTTPMHLVTTGGQTMYSTGVPATGGGGGAIIQVNNVTYGEGSTAKIYSPTDPGTPGYILKAADPSGFPEWVNISNLLPDASMSVKGVVMLSGTGNATTVAKSDHNHSGVYASASHNHTTLTSFQGITYVDSNSDPQNMLIRTGTGNNDILLGNADHNLTIRGDNVKIETGVSPRAGFWKSDGSGNLSVDTNTYLTGITKTMVDDVSCNADTVDSLHASSFLRSDAAISSDIVFAGVNGVGITFWDNPKYKITVTHISDTVYGGRITGENSSDWNMYFQEYSGEEMTYNRGFVFQSSKTDKLMAIHPSGIISNVGMTFNSGIVKGAVIGNYGVCSTAESTGAKTVTISGFRLATGVQINVKFSNNNYAYPITLNVSNTGAKTVKAYGDNDEQYFLEQIQAGAIVPFVYDGTYWVIPTTPSMY